MILNRDKVMSLEMFCALLNNNVDCHDQSMEYAEEVQVRSR